MLNKRLMHSNRTFIIYTLIKQSNFCTGIIMLSKFFYFKCVHYVKSTPIPDRVMYDNSDCFIRVIHAPTALIYY